MFPLGTVLFPTMVLPLHVFEPRYRAMTRHCLDGEREFGVVLIERGSEVGGGEVRTHVGTVATIADATELTDGRWVLMTVGTRRIRARTWLPDDPWPRAEVEDFPDPRPEAGTPERYRLVESLLRRVLALTSELGLAAVPATLDLADDPGRGSFQVAAVAPLGPADRQRVLASPTPATRLALLESLLVEEVAVCEARLALG